MFDKQLEADKLKGDQALAQINAQADANIGAAEVQAIIEATKAQAVQTGIKWVDGLNALVRPLVSLRSAFGVDEKAASVASFWLVDRSLRKMFGR